MKPAITVALDYRPALHRGFGIGRYVANLVPSLLAEDQDLRLRLYGVFLRGRRERIANHTFPADPRATFHTAPLPARWVPRLARVLPISARTFTGDFDLFHDTDYAVTPVRRRPRVSTLYDTAYLKERGYVSDKQSAHMYAIVEQLCRGVSRIITISEFARQDLIKAFRLDPDRISVTHLGVDPLFTSEVSPAEVEAQLEAMGIERPYCLFVGTLEPRKNLVRLVKAFALLVEKEPEYHLVLVGQKGFGGQRVFDVIEALQLERSVHWLGVLPDREVLLLLKGADVMAYPSLYEGFGLPALEGMAAGVPVLSSDSHALREVCGDGALLVDPRDEMAIYEGLRTLALDRGEAIEIAERGQKRAATFTWARCARETLAAYAAALEEG